MEAPGVEALDGALDWDLGAFDEWEDDVAEEWEGNVSEDDPAGVTALGPVTPVNQNVTLLLYSISSKG